MTSSQPIITPNSLNFTPDNKFCYAYNVVAASTTNQTVFNINTNSEYIDAVIQLNAAVNPDDPAAGNTSGADILFNNVRVAVLKVDGGAEHMPAQHQQNFIIPPFTLITVIVDSDDNQATRYVSVGITGRVYGMVETDYQ